MKTGRPASGWTGSGVIFIIRTIEFVSSEVGNFAGPKDQNGGSWGYEPPR
jgi:hypothetical protein